MRRINLLPPEIAARRRVRQQTGLLGVVFVVFLLLLGALWFVRQGTLRQEEEKLLALEAQQAELQAKVDALQEFALLEQTVTQKRTTLATAMANDVAWSRLLVELSMIIPGDSWLTAFSGTAAAPAAGAPGAPPATAPAPGTAAPASTLGTLSFTAITFDFPGVAKWITRLQELKSLQNIWVPSAAKGEISGRDVVNYSSTAELSKDASSGRYQQGGGVQ